MVQKGFNRRRVHTFGATSGYSGGKVTSSEKPATKSVSSYVPPSADPERVNRVGERTALRDQ